ncbi:MAG: hypothetical protein QXO27_03280 [Candidatus Aenigmatarchaeota archaeon]
MEIQNMIDLIITYNCISFFFLLMGIPFCYKILRNIQKNKKYALISIYNKKEGRYAFLIFALGGLAYGIILLISFIYEIGWTNQWPILGILIPSVCQFMSFFLLAKITSEK